MSDGINDLQIELRESVRRKRLAGEYPVGMEEQLEAEFRSILEVTYRGTHDLSPVETELKLLTKRVSSLRVGGSVDSRLPGGRLLHRVFRRLMRRHLAPVVEDIGAALQSLERITSELTAAVNAQRRHDERLLNDVLGGVLDRLAVIDSLAIIVPELEKRIVNAQKNED